MNFPAAAVSKSRLVRLLSLDVDGVLTDGRLYYVGGELEAKAFDTQDGAALKMLQSTGVEVAIVTGRRSDAVTRRAAELGIHRLYQGAGDKAHCLEDLCRGRLLTAFVRDITPRRQAEMERERLIKEREDALTKVKMLSGMLPMCASCKKIRDEGGIWHELEHYLQ